MKIWCVVVVLLLLNLGYAQDLPKNSIYHVKSKWKNIDDQEIQIKDFKGQKIIMSMVYTECPHACPMLISKIKEIERKIEEKTKERYKIVLASFDAKRDTPEHLKKYIKNRNLDASKWVFLSSPNEATARELAVVLGISFKELEDGEFSHSNVISLLDERGVVLGKIESLNAEVESIVQKFKD